MSWLTHEGAAHIESVTVSNALFREIQRREQDSLRWFGERSADDLAILSEILGRAELFSHENVGEVNARAGSVRDRLLQHTRPRSLTFSSTSGSFSRPSRGSVQSRERRSTLSWLRVGG